APAPLLGLDGELDSSNPKEGKYSLKLRGRMTFHYRDFEGTAVADWDASWLKQSKKPAIWFPEITQRIILNPNTAYELSFWAKTDAVAKDNITFEAPGGVSINFKDDQDCVNQWKNYKLAIPPVNVEGAQIIRVKNCSDQTFWVDDIKITRKEIKLEAKADDSKKESFQPASVNPMPLAEKAVSSGTVSTENTRQAGEIPDFEKSPQDAIGILFDEEIRTFNLIPLPPNVEGSLEKRNAGNKTGWAIVPTPKEKGGNGAEMMYFTVFNDFPSWKGISGIKVEVEYFDATPGALVFRYDSTEDSIWMAMPPEETGLVLKGDKVWKKTVFSLASPAFKKRCNGGDFRFDFSRNKDSDPKENVILKKITVFKE
ncbi:MAG: hypothetical protein L6437_14025, partial [Kiritimatiellae bacterium]|nr:hypothetical protein [Kiritimatiellia bacterium]